MVSGNQLSKFGPEDVLMSEVLLTSTDGEPTVVDFYFIVQSGNVVVDDLGRTVFDSRTGKTCSEIDWELTLMMNQNTLRCRNGISTRNGCRAQPGTAPSSLKYLNTDWLPVNTLSTPPWRRTPVLSQFFRPRSLAELVRRDSP